MFREKFSAKTCIRCQYQLVCTSQHCILATPHALMFEHSCLMKAVWGLLRASELHLQIWVFTVFISNFNQNTEAVEWPIVDTQSKWPLDWMLGGRVAGLSLDRTLAHSVVTQKCSTDRDSRRLHCMSSFHLLFSYTSSCLWVSDLFSETFM